MTLEKSAVREKTLTIPEWDVTITVKGLTVYDVATARRAAKNDDDVFGVLLVIASVFDPETGKQVFEPSHRDMLMRASNDVIARLVAEIGEVSAVAPNSLTVAEKN